MVPGDGGGEDETTDHGRWLIGKLLDPNEDEFRDTVMYSQAVPLSDDEIDFIIDEFTDQELSELVAEIKSMVNSVPRRIQSMDRREFLKNTVKMVATGSLIADVVGWGRKGVEAIDDSIARGDTERTPEFYENFWPTSLEAFARLDAEDTEQLLRTSQVPWNTFVNRSTEMLTEAVPGDTVHVHGVYYRGYPREFFEGLSEVAESAESVVVYLVDPVEGRGEVSALELHQQREVLIHEYLMTRPVFREVLARPEEIFSWTAVPHFGDLTLNSVRALLHSLRFLETAYYFSSAHEGIRFQPISATDATPLRGRIILDAKYDPKLASFLRFEKGVIGTSNPTNGHVLCDEESLDLDRKTLELHRDFVNGFLYDEQQQLKAESREPYTPATIEIAYDHVRDRIDTLLAHSDVLNERTLREVQSRTEEFLIPPSWRDGSFIDLGEWATLRKERGETIRNIKALVRGDLGTSFRKDNPRLSPDGDAPKSVYDAALKYQGLK